MFLTLIVYFNWILQYFKIFIWYQRETCFPHFSGFKKKIKVFLILGTNWTCIMLVYILPDFLINLFFGLLFPSIFRLEIEFDRSYFLFWSFYVQTENAFLELITDTTFLQNLKKIPSKMKACPPPLKILVIIREICPFHLYV